eukprot:scaffold45531_cov63-Phaeocystis_antarctica.AAC.1
MVFPGLWTQGRKPSLCHSGSVSSTAFLQSAQVSGPVAPIRASPTQQHAKPSVNGFGAVPIFAEWRLTGLRVTLTAARAIPDRLRVRRSALVCDVVANEAHVESIYPLLLDKARWGQARRSVRSFACGSMDGARCRRLSTTTRNGPAFIVGRCVQPARGLKRATVAVQASGWLPPRLELVTRLELIGKVWRKYLGRCRRFWPLRRRPQSVRRCHRHPRRHIQRRLVLHGRRRYFEDFDAEPGA